MVDDAYDSADDNSDDGTDGWDDGDNPDDMNNADVDVNFGFALPGFRFQLGTGDFDRLPLRSRSARVCFFERSYFRGDSFCVRPGERLPRLGEWNNQISSIDVRGNARALVCDNNNFGGRCVVVSRDLSTLGTSGNDKNSSIRVR